MVPKLSPLHRNLLLGFVLILAFAVLYSWLSPRPQPAKRTVTEQRTVTTSREQEETARKLALRQQIIEEQGKELQQLRSRQANVQTRIVERIERYPQPVSVPAPSTSPAPVVVVRDGDPQPVPAAVPQPPIEVIVRTTETVDRSREDERTDQTGTMKTTTDTQVDDVSTTRRTVDMKTDDDRKMTTVVGKPEPKPREEPLARFGAGILAGPSGPAGFVQYDLVAGRPLKRVKVFGLNKLQVGLGIGAAKGLEGDVQPLGEANIGGKNLFINVGVRGRDLKQLDPFVGVGYRRRF